MIVFAQTPNRQQLIKMSSLWCRNRAVSTFSCRKHQNIVRQQLRSSITQFYAVEACKYDKLPAVNKRHRGRKPSLYPATKTMVTTVSNKTHQSTGKLVHRLQCGADAAQIQALPSPQEVTIAALHLQKSRS